MDNTLFVKVREPLENLLDDAGDESFGKRTERLKRVLQ